MRTIDEMARLICDYIEGDEVDETITTICVDMPAELDERAREVAAAVARMRGKPAKYGHRTIAQVVVEVK